MLQNAKPIWLSGRSTEMNTLAVFRTTLCKKGSAELHVAAASYYRAFLDGRFLGYGPARAAKGYARVDILPFSLDGGEHELILEVEGFYCESLSTVHQPSFCMAEVLVDGESVALTGRDFEGYAPSYHVQKVDRYSVQRHFTEVRDYRNGTAFATPASKAEIEVLSLDLTLLQRGVPYPKYDAFSLNASTARGTLTFDAEREAKVLEREKPYNANQIRWGNFEYDEMPTRPYKWFKSQRQTITGGAEELPIEIGAGEYVRFDFGQIETSFLQTSFEALEDTDAMLVFSEYCEGDELVNYNSVKNALEYFANAGQVLENQSIEPYSCRFLAMVVRSGRIRLTKLGGVRFEHPTDGLTCPDLGSDMRNLIYRASVRTFAQNALDIYTDCPSRERAGWLCDSYFSGRVEPVLFGTSEVEKAFLENFRLYQNGGELPAGALPMCYPADFINNNDFIPQWDMWYVLEVEEFLFHRCPDEDREQFRASVMGVIDFLSRYENSDGLLEALPSWNFVEWSRANKWTKDVNYPTNFLYARTLRAAYNIFGGEELLKKSELVAKEAVRQSFNGTLFTDHAIRREDGTLENAGDISEICQYYAILLADLDLDAPAYAEMLRMVREVFLPGRLATPEFDVEPINAFIGVYLRMDTLLKLEAYEQALEECEAFFGPMAQKTNTLWENLKFTSGSCNHGFASYAALVMMKCLEKLK